MKKKDFLWVWILCIVLLSGLCSSCGKKEKSLIVYAGQGLKNAVQEIEQTFEDKHGIEVTVIYGGSNTLLETLKKTRKGDVFIPGSVAYIKKAGDLVSLYHLVGVHVPAIAVHKDNPQNIETFEDLLRPGIKIAVGNKDMCAMGNVTEKILAVSGKMTELKKNIYITSPTVNELLSLVNDREADAAFIWADMLQSSEAAALKMIEIPPAINEVREIPVAVLNTSSDPSRAKLFADFTASEGKDIFTKHGFGAL